MAYIDTPATERGEMTNLSDHNIDFSFAQPFGSPSKNPAENLRNQMRGLRAGSRAQAQPLQTPRVRNTLLDKRNPPGMQKQEFTPLLKSAKRKGVMHLSIPEEKENSAIPTTPREFKSSFVSHTPGLPVNSSMIDGDETTGSMMGSATPAALVESSSMYDSTPIPRLAGDGQAAVLEQGNVLTLRDQEAKLDQIQKDNFGLKLKIHYLEEALRKTGSEFHQATMKENVELKTAKFSLEHEMKKQRKRLMEALQQLEEYRIKYEEYVLRMKERPAKGVDQGELDRLRRSVEESKKIADEREQELDEMRQRLEDTAKESDESEEVRRLRDEVQDLEAEMRDRERQLEEKDEQLESIQDQLKEAKTDSNEAENLQQDIDELEAEIRDKESALANRDARIAELEEQVNADYDREASTEKLRNDVSALQSELRQKSEALDDAEEKLRTGDEDYRQKLENLESQLRSKTQEFQQSEEQFRQERRQAETDRDVHLGQLRQKEGELQNAERELADKDGEVQALQERLRTARGSWDAEAKETDARIQERDDAIREREGRLREQSQVIAQRDAMLAELQAKLRRVDNEKDQNASQQTKQLREQNDQIRELREEVRTTKASFQARMNEKDGLIEARKEELHTLQNRFMSLKTNENTQSRQHQERLSELEALLKKKEVVLSDQSQQILSLKSRLGAMETPSRKDSLIKQQAEQVRTLHQQLQKVSQDKDQELDELEQQLQECETENAELRSRMDLFTRQAETATRDHSIIGHKDDDLRNKQSRILSLEDELEQLRIKLRTAVDQRQFDVRNLERELENARKNQSDHSASAQQQLTTLRSQLELQHAQSRQELEDELLVLEANLEQCQSDNNRLQKKSLELEGDLQRTKHKSSLQQSEERSKCQGIEIERDALKATIRSLESRLDEALKSKPDDLVSVGRNESQYKLREAEAKVIQLERRIAILESDLENAQQEKTLAEERIDLHEMLRQSKIEAEQLQIQLLDKDRRLQGSTTREAELRAQVTSLEGEQDDLQAEISDAKARLQASTSKEADLRRQLKELRDANAKLAELEEQVGERQGSASGHARKEAELRSQLREAKAEMDNLRLDVEEKDVQLRTSAKKERELRERLRQSRMEDNLRQDLHIQVTDAEAELQALQQQLRDRAIKLRTSLKREQSLRDKVSDLERVDEGDRTLLEKQFHNLLVTAEKKHAGELKGLVRQIQYLRARCSREETFRSDLVYTKKWFLMQVEMYNQCNQADLRLLEDMGITPDISFREKKHSLRTIGLTVLATVRMQRLQQAWAGNRKLHESIVKKLEGMRRPQNKGGVGR